MQTMKRQTLWMRAAVLLLALISTTMMWADQVTAEQAREQALAFVKNRLTANGRRLAPGAMPQLKQESQINGLYVFNVADNGGFVIVSNDDATIPILGFSDNGHIDADNMPDNMRAWLQGYADEIAWLQKQPAQSRQSARSRAPRQVGSHSTNAIEPLLGETKWNQGSPYNGLCPKIGNSTCVTGCVATAMAQVMYYTETKADNSSTVTTAAIPSYSWNSTTLGPIAAGSTINWAHMTPTYNNNSTDQAKTAVATLMKYCGYSVGMNYGTGGSSAPSRAIADALKNYFDYNETTQFVMRKLYSYAKWTDLIYFELAHNRPVIYSGQSSGGGHEFVCDGYQYQNNTDFFHINWGWGGQSNEYFVLSALDPDEQGIGGSSSTDGYRYDQDAIIGIQKSTDNGEMSSIVQNDINLKLNSMTLSSTHVVVGNEITITLNITNNSADDFEEGEIYVGRIVGNSISMLVGDYFAIPSGQTKDCVISFTPQETGTYNLVFWRPNNSGSFTTDGEVKATLTVVQSETYLPPTNLAATPTSQSAIISWTGYTNKYKMKYRTAETGFYYDFESGLDGWTVYTMGESPFDNGWVIPTISGHNGGHAAGAFSSNGNNAYNADNWLITPQIDIQGCLTFWEYTYNNYWADTYEVLLSTTGKDISDFTTTLRPMTKATDEWSEVSIDLSAYAGQTGYIAIHHKCSDQYYLLIDDFSVGYEPAGNWTEVANVVSPYNITGLQPNTKYEYQIIGMNGSNEVSSSAMAYFTTSNNAIELADNEDNSSLIDSWNNQTATVTLAGRTLFKNGQWNTLCLPFAVSTTSGPLAGDGVTAKVFNNSTSGLSGSTLTLNFDNASATIPAGTPFIIKWNNTGSNLTEANLVFQNVTINNTTHNVTCNLGNNKSISFKGTYAKQTYNAENKSILFVGSGNKLNYPQVGASIGAQRAYFELTGFSAANAASRIVLNIDGEATGISEVSRINEKGETWYTLDGRLLQDKPTRKGVYVVNGKVKVIK